MVLLSSEPTWPTLPDYFHDWALVDVETSGLRPGRDRVLSLAVLTLDARGNPTGEFSTLLNPGCDPGPVHVHGLTAARLAGAPTFEEIAPRVGALLSGRVLVAHNAQFDYDFLAHEFAHVRSWVPVGRRLCTLALNRLIGPAVPDLKLGTLAAHYGVRQERAHDAQDDVRVLSGILRGSLGAAERLGLSLPLLDCPPRQDYKPYVPKTPCPYRNPGRYTPGGPLVQGMKVAITGDTRVSREELVARSVAAGLNMMTSVSGRTSLVVTNDPAAASAKLRRAVDEGVPLVDEPTYLRLLEDVRPGRAKGVARQRGAEAPADRTTTAPDRTITVPPAPPAPTPEIPAQRAAAPVTPPVTPDRPLAGRRVLVLGGTHEAAVEARGRVVALGASAAVNLSAGVTDVVVLPGGEADRRMSRIAALGLPVHEAAWLLAPEAVERRAPATAGSAAEGRPDAARVLVRGAVIDLADTGTAWTVAAAWRQQAPCDVDVVAFAVDAQEQVAGDEDFVFYGAPEHPDGTLRLATDGPTEQAVTVDLERLPLETHRVVIAAAIDGAATFSDVGAVEITATCGVGAAPAARATLDAATTERTMILAEIYRRGERWRLRAVGQGYDHGLADLARGYGVDVAD
ncbi:MULTISPECIES: TerD family protein [Streptomyces]|uniref:DNA polymerase III n=2 Tax=Streptomyces TaxID=1883 RepID=A0A2U9PAJ9_STRAS|nr:TerD family protein [Streptomyces actuosus]AWT45998.1 DNA polymerase III [Streptomyces actuosus]MBM4822653.1 TerD family protein [Streptomyces actuosus]